MKPLPNKYCLFCGWKEHIEEARKYIRDNKLTSEDVRLVCYRKDGQIFIETKRAGVMLPVNVQRSV